MCYDFTLLVRAVATAKCYLTRFFAVRRIYDCDLALYGPNGLVIERAIVEVSDPAYWCLRDEPISYLKEWFGPVTITINGQEYFVDGDEVLTLGHSYRVYGKLLFKHYQDYTL